MVHSRHNPEVTARGCHIDPVTDLISGSSHITFLRLSSFGFCSRVKYMHY